jgi:hypothetical protein
MTELNNSFEAPPAQSLSPRPPATRMLVWAGAVLLLLIIAAVGGWWFMPHEFHGVQLQSPRLAEDFTLPTSTGETMSLSDFRGKYVVLFFGYTYCPDVCPTTLNDIQQMLKTLGPNAPGMSRSSWSRLTLNAIQRHNSLPIWSTLTPVLSA